MFVASTKRLPDCGGKVPWEDEPLLHSSEVVVRHHSSDCRDRRKKFGRPMPSYPLRELVVRGPTVVSDRHQPIVDRSWSMPTGILNRAGARDARLTFEAWEQYQDVLASTLSWVDWHAVIVAVDVGRQYSGSEMTITNLPSRSWRRTRKGPTGSLMVTLGESISRRRPSR